MKNLLVSLVAASLLACTPASLNENGIPSPNEGEVNGAPKGAPSSSRTPAPDAPPPSTPRTTDLHHSMKGDPKNQPVVFLHGGPGANSLMFELTAQESIANRGYYVVAYDQRGSTRSPKGAAPDYSYAKATQDLDDLISALGLEKPILLGHSFGGSLALRYLDRFPGKAKGAILVASPVDFPATYETTLTACAARYRMWGRFSEAKRVETLRSSMFPNGVTPPFTYGSNEISGVIQCLSDAKLYFPPLPTLGEISFALEHGLDSNVSDVNGEVGSAFQANDRIGHLSFVSLLAAHKNEVVGIYAPSWDVMFDKAQLAVIRANVRAYFTVADAGHFVFMDQPESFTSTTATALATFQ